MATIHRYPFLKQARVEASQFLAVFRNGRPVQSGRGLAVWFSPHGATSLVEIPADERDHELQISATTRDFQTVSVQGTATWRAASPMTLADPSTSPSISPAAPGAAILSSRSRG